MSNYSRITTLRNMQEQIAHAGTLIADLQKTIVALQGTNAALKGTKPCQAFPNLVPKPSYAFLSFPKPS